MGRGVELSGCGKCIRFFMFIVNFIVWLASIALLVLGVWTVLDRPYLEKLLGSEMYMTAAYILIGTGCFMFFVSFLGCLGALKEVKCMLLTYFIILLLLFIVLLVGGILGTVFRSRANTTLNNAMMSSIKEYGEDNTALKKAWDETQQALKCCALRSQDEWVMLNKDFSAGGNLVPESCCKMDPTTGELMNCQTAPSEVNSYTDGCYAKALGLVLDNALIVGAVGIAVAMMMVFGLVCSIILFTMIK